MSETAFNGGTTNVFTLGTTFANANELLAAGTVVPGNRWFHRWHARPRHATDARVASIAEQVGNQFYDTTKGGVGIYAKFTVDRHGSHAGLGARRDRIHQPDQYVRAEMSDVVQVTYTPKAGDPVTTTWHGFTFEANKPTAIPADHELLEAVKTNDWFTTPDKKSAKKPAGPPTTPDQYFTYAVAWIQATTSSGQLTSKWANEEPMRTKVGWGSDDEDRIKPILGPKLDTLKKAEKQMGN